MIGNSPVAMTGTKRKAEEADEAASIAATVAADDLAAVPTLPSAGGGGGAASTVVVAKKPSTPSPKKKAKTTKTTAVAASSSSSPSPATTDKSKQKQPKTKAPTRAKKQPNQETKKRANSPAKKSATQPAARKGATQTQKSQPSQSAKKQPKKNNDNILKTPSTLLRGEVSQQQQQQTPGNPQSQPKKTRQRRTKKPKEQPEQTQQQQQDPIVAVAAAVASASSEGQAPKEDDGEEILGNPLETAQRLLHQVEIALFSVQPDLDATKELLMDTPRYTNIGRGYNPYQGNITNQNASLGAVSRAVTPNTMTTTTNANAITTGGHSNTNHQVIVTGDPIQDRILELKRHYYQRQRNAIPETKGQQKWDRPRQQGQRRRRIRLELHENANAPNDPPPTGFVIFVGQMTCKIRHDRPHDQHFQPLVMQEIAKIWKDDMTDEDRQYYMDFASEARQEYIRQQMEYRATGSFTPSQVFQRLGNNNNDGNEGSTANNNSGGPWVRIDPDEKNGLEREISAYETVIFPPRPPAMDQDYQWRDWKSKVTRKLKDKKLLAKDWHLFHGNLSSAAAVSTIAVVAVANHDYEDQIIGQAVTHAKETFMDAAGLTLESVDHSAVIAAATAEATAKLLEFRAAQEAAAASDANPDESVYI